MNKRMLFLLTAVIILLLSPAAAAAPGGLYPPMDGGALDSPGEPFDYFKGTTSVLGTAYGTNGTEVTPEGYLFTGYAELGFFIGGDLQPVNQRVKTLEKGYLPVVNMRFSSYGINYDFQMFGASMDGSQEGALLNFVKVTISNPGGASAFGWFGAGIRYGRSLPNRSQSFMQREVEIGMFNAFKPNWRYTMENDSVLRAGKMVYQFDTPADFSFIKAGVAYDKSAKSMAADNKEADWVGINQWRIPLKPGESRSIIIKMPFAPADKAEAAKVRAADYAKALASTTKYWDGKLAEGTMISVPEDKVNGAYKANLIYEWIAFEKKGGDYIQHVNQFQYRSFWLRDGSFMLLAYDMLGHPADAENGARYFLKYQDASGIFQSQRGQLDGFGQTLWLFGEHYKLTRDKAFLDAVYPATARSMGWLHEARKAHRNELGAPDRLGWGLMPISNPGDNEQVNGHVVGHDLWGLLGAREAAYMAAAEGKTAEADSFNKEYADYHAAMLKWLKEVARRTGGYITPALEPGGYDWGNLKLVWPSEVLDPSDPMVAATMKMARSKFQEGIMTYQDGHSLHHYITIDVALTELIRDEQYNALDTFYSLLLHTGSTHGGFEWVIKPWGDRNYGGNLAPHGCFSGKYLLMYRDMFAREQGNDLHLASLLSPSWLAPGKTVEFENGPTYFGPVSFTIRAKEGGASVEIEPPARGRPDHIILHLPPNITLTGATVNGKKASGFARNSITLSPTARRVELKWKAAKPDKDYSFDAYVKEYIHNYHALYP